MAGKLNNKFSFNDFSFNDFKELFFPVFRDFNSINSEIDTKFISNNNWDLANDAKKYQSILSKIEEAKGLSSSNSIEVDCKEEDGKEFDYYVLK